MDWIAQFREDGQRRLDRLVADVGIGEPLFSREALLTLWSWVLPRLRERTSQEPVDLLAAPPWWGRQEHYRPARWDDTTLDRAGALAYHLGETLVGSQPGARWAYSDREDDAEAGEALVRLELPERWVNPLVVVLNAFKAARYGTAGPTFLRDVYDETLAQAPEPARSNGDPRLSLRVVAPARGPLRRRAPLPRRLVEQQLQKLLDEQVVLPARGDWSRAYAVGDPPECQVELAVRSNRGGVGHVGARVTGAPEDAGSEQPALRRLLLAFLDLAEAAGAFVEGRAEAAVDEDWRLRGRIDREDVPIVLAKTAPAD
jgi:hypothetical protein